MPSCSATDLYWTLQVEPVTKDYRITLTYDLFVDSKAWSAMPPTPTVDASAIDSIPVHAALQAALSDPTFLPSGEQSAGLALHPHTSYPTFANRGAAQPASMLIRVEVVMAEQRIVVAQAGHWD